MVDINYTTTASQNTVKPTQTTFTNNTGKSITLAFSDSTSQVVAAGATTGKLSKTISSINYAAQYYYSSAASYTILANKAATISVSGKNLVLHIP